MPSYPKQFLLPLFCLALAFPVSAGPAAIPNEMAAYFPVGRTFTGVKIPSYSNDVLKTIMEAETVTRVDTVYLKLTNLVVKAYNSEGVLESTVSMDKARYSLTTRQLVSETPAKVTHEKFVMTGDQMAYDTGREVSTLTGNVRVVIPDASEFTGGNFGMDALEGK